MGGEGDPLGNVQEIEIWPYEQTVYVQPRISPTKWDAQTSLGFWDTNGSSNLGQTTRPTKSRQQKENMPNSGLCHSNWPQGKTERKQKEW